MKMSHQLETVTHLDYCDLAKISPDSPFFVAFEKVGRVKWLCDRGYGCDKDKAMAVGGAAAAN